MDIFKNKNNLNNILKNEKFINIFSKLDKLIKWQDWDNLRLFLDKNIDTLTSNEWISNLKILMEEKWDKYYHILWAIFSRSTRNKNYELASLFSETNETTDKLIQENKDLKTKNKTLKEIISKKDTKLSEQEKSIKVLDIENSMLQEENRYLRPNAKAYSDILKILIENNFMDKWENVQEIIEKIIKWNNISSKLIKWLEKEWIMLKLENWKFWLSPKTKIILNELNRNEKQSLERQKTISEEKEETNNSIIKNKKGHKINKYNFHQINKEENNTEKYEDKNFDIIADITWEFLVEIDNLKKINKTKDTQIEEIKNNLNKKELELQKQYEEIEKLKQELANIKKNSWETTTPAHIMKKAHETYNKNK